MADDDPYRWSPDQVRTELCSPDSFLRAHLNVKPILNLQMLEQALRDNDIDGESLLSLEDANVKDDLGISSFGQRREIRKIILHLRTISSHYEPISENHNKRRLTSDDDKEYTTPDSKRRRTDLSHSSANSTLPNHNSETKRSDLPSRSVQDHSLKPAEPPKRRIQPQNLSTEPVTRNRNVHVESMSNIPTRISSNLTMSPESFNPEDLSDEWKDFLDRHGEESDDTILRPYNESDSEKELDSEDDASLVEELELEEPLITPRLSVETIEGAIDGTLQAYTTAWNTFKRPKKYKIAHRRWMQAAKARTRKPQQNALQRQLGALQDRLAKFRRSIADIGMDYHKVDEVKRNCLNLQATVEDIAEKNYYLEVLTSDSPPTRPDRSLQSPVPDETLSIGEELLESSDSAEELEEEQSSDTASEMSLASEDDSGLSLPYDPADHEWNPVLPSPEVKQRQSPLTLLTNAIEEAAANTHAEVTDLEEMHVVPSFADLETDSDNRRLLPDSLPVPTLVPRGISPMSIGTQKYFNPMNSQATQSHKPASPEDNEDSDMDALPKNKFRNEGNTWDTAISLGSSPSRSEDTAALTDHSIRTPPLNPTFSPSIKHERTPSLEFPPIQELRAKKWGEVRDDARLALCKIVYRADRAIARSVLNFISPLPTNKIPDRLRAGISFIQDISDEDMPEDGGSSDPLIVLTFFFVIYALERGFKEVWTISEEKLDMAFNVIPTKTASFDKLLRPLLKYYIGTDSSKGTDTLSSQRKSQQHRGSTSKLSGYRANSAISRRPSTPPPKSSYTDTETDADEEPSSIKKRKRHVQQSQEALSQQRDDQLRVREQEKRRQMMMDKLESQILSGEDRRVIINSVEDVPILLDQHIARRIKPHQEAGVQFIWRELVEDKKHQGCLLAHTMGLGKTMQVVSFLVTLAQCNASEREEVRALIPHGLRSGRILILCPASLVDNWHDELSMWIPPDVTSQNSHSLLGNIYTISGTREFKIKTVKRWKSRAPGVLIIGYESLRSLLVSKSINDEDKKYLETALLQDPCVVVGDEAHKMKNAKSGISKLAKQFRTSSRIALTGSPLNNHLEEYHTMIDWIAPGYLGNLVQFKAKYSEPIERGLNIESTRYERRKSLERLYVLKRDLAPKIDRKDISAIASDMPQKTEFFITVPLTELQKSMYSLLVQHLLTNINGGGSSKKASSNAQLWSWLSILSWLCNHPTILIDKLERDEGNMQPIASNEDAGNEGAPANIDINAFPLATLLPQFKEQYARLEADGDMYDPDLSIRTVITKLLIQESVKNGERILLFSHSIPTLNYLQDMLDDMQYKYLRIDGSVRPDQRQAATKEFNDTTNDCMVFLISTRAGGLGLNLQGATRVIIYDFGFNPSWEEQAIGRAYRLGQKKPVFVYRFRAGGTYEDVQYNKSIFKTQLFSRVVDQKNVVRQTSRDVKAYLFEPKDPEQMDLTESLGKDDLIDRVVEMVPGAIRELILTETFQREDEDDELTVEEKRAADEEVEMQRLQRANPQAYIAKLAEKQKLQAQARIANVPQNIPNQSPFFAHGQINSDHVRGWFADPSAVDETVTRDVARANKENVEGVYGSTSETLANEGEEDGAEDQTRPPGCEAQ